MRDLRAEDPAEVVIAWEAVEDLLAPIPETPAKDVLRLVAAGLSTAEIGQRLGLSAEEVEALAARGRIRVLTAAVAGRLGGEPCFGGSRSVTDEVGPSSDGERRLPRT